MRLNIQCDTTQATHTVELAKIKALVKALQVNVDKISTNSYIPNSVINYLHSISDVFDVSQVFRTKEPSVVSSKRMYNYFVDVTCCSCKHTIKQRRFTKTDLIAYIKNKSFICEACKDKQMQKMKEEQEKQKQENNKQVCENTNTYIASYLNPEYSWNSNVSISAKYNEVRYVNVNWNDIQQHIQDMPYNEFLRTPYWKAISEKAKQRVGYKCALCGSNKKLETHHRTYEHHGQELFHISDDLIVLCDTCHKKFHDIT